MGARCMFDRTANLSSFSESMKIHMNNLTQMAKIDVDEEGSTAIAFTYFTFALISNNDEYSKCLLYARENP